MARKKLGEILIAEGVLDETRLRAALIEQQRWGGPLGRLLIEMKLIEEHVLVDALSRQLAIPAVDLDAIEVTQAVCDLVPGELCEHHSIMPFGVQLKFLDVAMADPTNLGITDELQIRTRLNVRPHLAGPRAIERAIARYYGRGFAGSQLRQTGRPARQTMRSHAIELDTGPKEKMELVQNATALGGVEPLGNRSARDAEIQALQQRVSRLEALVQRDEAVLRKVLALLVDKGVASRDEIVERLK